jgi:hypothetical protein
MHVGQINSNLQIKIPYLTRTNQWWLSLHLLELINFDPDVRFEKKRAHRKFKEMKKTLEVVSMDEVSVIRP